MIRLLLSILALLASAFSAHARKPNIVVILADDQGWGDLGIHGNTNLATPALDSLAKSGASFDRFYVCSVCAPTRAEFFTGRYHPRTGVRGVSTGQERLNTDERTIADVFKDAGYATGAFGKWHNGSQWPYHPNARGWQQYYGFTSGHWGEYFDAPLERNGSPVRGSGYITDDFTSRALEFIEANRAQPFLCYIPYNVPHSPFCVPREDWARFEKKEITMRGPDGDRETVDVTRAALAMIERMDASVARILAKLDELKLAEDTIVVFFSDNGPNSARWNGGMKGRKGSVDEGGLRSPLFIRWPGKIAPGTKVAPICGAIDLLPTLAALAGVQPGATKPLDGRDASPLLLGKSADWPERMIFSHQNGKISVRTQTHRLDDAGRLFDMIADPGQTKPVEDAETGARLKAAVAAWRAEVLPKGKDDRPFPVGHPGSRVTPLPARDGVPHGGVKRSAPAPNCSYFVNWTNRDDSMTWDVEVLTAGDYEVVIHYTCPDGDAGSLIELSHGTARLAGKVTPAWNPPLITDQDVIPRPKAESIMKEFRPLALGTIRLEKGRAPLTLRALETPGKTIAEVRQITLTRK